MALTFRTNGSGVANIVTAGWWDDYYNLLTGVMSDQPVTVANTLTANNLQVKGASGNLQLYTNQGANVAALQYLYQPGGTATGILFQAWNGSASQNLFSIGTTAGMSYIGTDGWFHGNATTLYNGVGTVGILAGDDSASYTWVRPAAGPRGLMGKSIDSGQTLHEGWHVDASNGQFHFTTNDNQTTVRSITVWEGSTDPGGNANEGDIWVVG